MKAIVCTTTDGSIGRNGDQLYYISEDLKRFKNLTKDSTVVMGMNTFMVLPEKPLPNRTNIVISSNTERGSYTWNGRTLVKNEHGDIFVTSNIKDVPSDSWCIGGGQIYNLFLNLVDEIYITEVQKPGLKTDVKFPELPVTEWVIYDTSEVLTDSKTGLTYKYRTAKRL